MKSGVNPYLKTDLGKNALDLAILFEREDIYELLSTYSFPSLEMTLLDILIYYSKKNFYGEDVDLNSMTEYGEHPIHIAVKRKEIEEVKCLINSGVNLDSKVNNGFEFTPLHYSIGKKDVEMMRFLLKNNANFKVKSEK